MAKNDVKTGKNLQQLISNIVKKISKKIVKKNGQRIMEIKKLAKNREKNGGKIIKKWEGNGGKLK